VYINAIAQRWKIRKADLTRATPLAQALQEGWKEGSGFLEAHGVAKFKE